jgi:hypothetical protein
MKHNHYPSLLFILISVFSLPAFSQFNPYDNTFSPMPAKGNSISGKSYNPAGFSSPSGVLCRSLSFWAITRAKTDSTVTRIDQFSLIDTVITKIDSSVISNDVDLNLAYCNNVNGGLYTPTFYTTRNHNQIVSYNGTDFTPTSGIATKPLLNCGGNGDYLYFMEYDSLYNKAESIVKYNGTGLTTIYTFPSTITATVADIAVDQYGDAWFFSGKDNGLFNTDTIKVFSPGGQPIKMLPFSYNTLNGYGCFLLNSVLFIGLGPSNGAHPNTLLPITVNPDTAFAGTPAKMHLTTSYSDLASCTPGSPLGVSDPVVLQDVIVFPNPVKNYLTIQNNTNESLEFTLFDMTDRELLHRSFTTRESINIALLPPGIYLYKIMNKSGLLKSGKILKQ